MSCHRFLVHGAASPDLPLRVLNMFAQQDIVFDGAEVVRAGDRYSIRVELQDLAQARADVILEKIRMMVLVESAELAS